jgi:hypothetical protein
MNVLNYYKTAPIDDSHMSAFLKPVLPDLNGLRAKLKAQLPVTKNLKDTLINRAATFLYSKDDVGIPFLDFSLFPEELLFLFAQKLSVKSAAWPIVGFAYWQNFIKTNKMDVQLKPYTAGGLITVEKSYIGHQSESVKVGPPTEDTWLLAFSQIENPEGWYEYVLEKLTKCTSEELDVIMIVNGYGYRPAWKDMEKIGFLLFSISCSRGAGYEFAKSLYMCTYTSKFTRNLNRKDTSNVKILYQTYNVVPESETWAAFWFGKLIRPGVVIPEVLSTSNLLLFSKVFGYHQQLSKNSFYETLIAFLSSSIPKFPELVNLLATTTDPDVITTYLGIKSKKNLFYRLMNYSAIMRRPELDFPHEIPYSDYGTLAWMTDRELKKYLDPYKLVKIDWSSFNRLETIKKLADAAHKPQWYLRPRTDKAANKDEIDLFTLEPRVFTEEDYALGYGTSLSYNCYTLSEITDSFREDTATGVVIFSKPGTSKEFFPYKSLKQLLTLLDPSTPLAQKISRGLEKLKSGDLIWKNSYSQLQESDKLQIQEFVLWLLQFGMVLRFWKGIGYNWIYKWKEIEERTKQPELYMSQQAHDMKVAENLGVYAGMTSLWSYQTKQWIEDLTGVVYNMDSKMSSPTEYNICLTIQRISQTEFCTAHASDFFIHTSIYCIVSLFGWDNTKVTSKLKNPFLLDMKAALGESSRHTDPKFKGTETENQKMIDLRQKLVYNNIILNEGKTPAQLQKQYNELLSGHL